MKRVEWVKQEEKVEQAEMEVTNLGQLHIVVRMDLTSISAQKVAKVVKVVKVARAGRIALAELVAVVVMALAAAMVGKEALAALAVMAAQEGQVDKVAMGEMVAELMCGLTFAHISTAIFGFLLTVDNRVRGEMEVAQG